MDKLKAILKRPENAECADCRRNNPTWASINLGIFLCLDCAGIHRSMGVHISKVRSVTLDAWEANWVGNISKVGNAVANAYWEANLPASHRVFSGADMNARSAFIRNKYERKLYIAKTPSQPLPLSSSQSQTSSQSQLGSKPPPKPQSTKLASTPSHKSQKSTEPAGFVPRTNSSHGSVWVKKKNESHSLNSSPKAQSTAARSLFAGMELKSNANQQTKPQPQHQPTTAPATVAVEPKPQQTINFLFNESPSNPSSPDLIQQLVADSPPQPSAVDLFASLTIKSQQSTHSLDFLSDEATDVVAIPVSKPHTDTQSIVKHKPSLFAEIQQKHTKAHSDVFDFVNLSMHSEQVPRAHSVPPRIDDDDDDENAFSFI